MKCELIRPMPVRNPEWSAKELAAARKARRPYHVPKYVEQPAGFVIEHPDAWRLVMLGCAKPADAECQQAAPLTVEQLADRAARYERLNRGQATGDPNLDADGPAVGVATDSEDDISDQAD